MIIIINSHPRSGTHFLIDSLRLNIDGSRFPNSYKIPKDFNIGSLFRDEQRIIKYFKRQISKHRILLVKSHLYPSLVEAAINSEHISSNARIILNKYWQGSIKLYIYRNIADVLVSLYHHHKSQKSFSDFIRESNDYAITNFVEKKELNRITYWDFHVTAWLNYKNVIFVKYENLLNNFEITLSAIFKKLNINEIEGFKKPVLQSGFKQNIYNKIYNLGINVNINSTNIKLNNKRLFKNSLDYYSDKDIKLIDKICHENLINLGYSSFILS